MKRPILNIAMVTSLMAGALFTACQSSDDKKAELQEKINIVDEDLKEMKAANAEDWSLFRSHAVEKINDNEVRIAALRVKMKSSGKTIDAIRQKRVEALEQQNKDLRSGITAYAETQTDWQAFKTEFNHDMDELAKSLDDLTEDSK